jgi:hypothetical protein
MNPEQLKMNVDIKQSTPIKSAEGNPILFAEGMILRKMSKFLSGTSEDALIPIPVMYDVNTNKILLDMVPKELREEYEDIGFYLTNS